MFVGSIRGKSENVAAYTTIVNSLKKLNCKVVADHVLKNSQNDLSKMSRSENIVFQRSLMLEKDLVPRHLNDKKQSLAFPPVLLHKIKDIPHSNFHVNIQTQLYRRNLNF